MSGNLTSFVHRYSFVEPISLLAPEPAFTAPRASQFADVSADSRGFRGLYKAVLEDAVECYQDYFGYPPHTEGGRIWLETERWFFGSEKWLSVSLEMVCAGLKIDARHIRRGLAAWAGKQKRAQAHQRGRAKIIPIRRELYATEVHP